MGTEICSFVLGQTRLDALYNIPKANHLFMASSTYNSRLSQLQSCAAKVSFSGSNKSGTYEKVYWTSRQRWTSLKCGHFKRGDISSAVLLPLCDRIFRRPIMLQRTFQLSWREAGQAVWPECWGRQVSTQKNHFLNQSSGRSFRTHLKPGLPDNHKRPGAQLGERLDRRRLGAAACRCSGSQ